MAIVALSSIFADFTETSASGDFRVTFDSVTVPANPNARVLLGAQSSTTHFIAFGNNATAGKSEIRLRMNGVDAANPMPVDENATIKLVIERIGTTITATVNDGTPHVLTSVFGATFIMGRLFNYGGGGNSTRYVGTVSGNMEMVGFTGGTRTYDFEDSSQDPIVQEKTNGFDATLQNQQTGEGFTSGDTVPPVITLLGDNPLSLVQGTPYVEPGYTATDDVDGDITGDVVVGGDTVDENTVGTYNITYDVSDAAGNAATQQIRIVNVIAEADTTPPVITLLGANPFNVIQGNPYVEPGYTAIDDVDGDITANVVVGGTVDENTLGTYNLTYDVDDAAGNSAIQQVRQVDVVAAPSGSISITSVVDNQCKVRDNNGQAVFTIAGTYTGTPTAIEYQLDGGAWQTLDAAPSGGNYTGNVTITNQQDLAVRLNNETVTTASVSKLSAALVICEGVSQSNGAGRGINNQPFSPVAGSPSAIMWKPGPGFEVIADPTGDDGNPNLGGSVWPQIAQRYAEKGIPVCIGNVAVGGTKAAMWIPGAPEDHHSRIVAFATACGGLSFLTTCIGESDANDNTGLVQFKQDYLDAVNPVISAYNCDVYCTYTVRGDGFNSLNLTNQVYVANDQNIAEQARIFDGGFLGDIDIDTGTAPGNDGVHLKQDADLEEAADIRYNAFNGVTSSASIAITGIPDGTFDVAYYTVAGIDLSTPTVIQVTAVNGKIEIGTPLAVGTPIVGLLPGPTPPTTGDAIYGVTF